MTRFGPLLVLLCLGTGCTRWGFTASGDARHGPLDGLASDLSPADGPPPHDAPAPGPGCLPWTTQPAFGPPQPVTAANSPYVDQEPFLSRDGLTLYFCSNRPGGAGGYDLYTVSRPDLSSPFGEPQNLTALNTPQNELRFIITMDGLTAYLTTDWPGGAGKSDIWSATRVDVHTPLSRADFTPVVGINTASSEHDPFPSADNSKLYYYTDDWHSSDSGADLLVAQRSGSPGVFGAPAPIAGANHFPAAEGNPVLSPDGLLLVFSSDRPGSVGLADLWFATRQQITDPFTVQQPIAAVSTAAYENNEHLTPDGCTLYFCREGDIYVARIDAGATP